MNKEDKALLEEQLEKRDFNTPEEAELAFQKLRDPAPATTAPDEPQDISFDERAIVEASHELTFEVGGATFESAEPTHDESVHDIVRAAQRLRDICLEEWATGVVAAAVAELRLESTQLQEAGGLEYAAFTDAIALVLEAGQRLIEEPAIAVEDEEELEPEDDQEILEGD